LRAEKALRPAEPEIEIPDFTPVQISKSEKFKSQASSFGSRKKHSWLKRKMSKKRWSRRLGTFLFGWEWKKVKITRGDMHLERIKESFKGDQ
jgi:hypothetical protein